MRDLLNSRCRLLWQTDKSVGESHCGVHYRAVLVIFLEPERFVPILYSVFRHPFVKEMFQAHQMVVLSFENHIIQGDFDRLLVFVHVNSHL